jgi:hypothetical protein
LSGCAIGGASGSSGLPITRPAPIR